MNNKNMTNRATLLSEEQSAALQLMLSGRNVFLTGEAGTGKSTILHELRKRYGDEGIVFLAPTGMAASNIKGQTIHSFFRLTPGLLSPDTIEELGDSRTRMLLSEVQTVVIDEISMVRSDVFAAIDHRFREVACGENRNRPFAGKQVIVCGDFFQLPPIVSGDTELTYLQKKLGGKYPFMTELWQKAEFEVVMLKEVHRQCSDPKFMEILRHIRHGEMDLCDLQLPGESKQVNCITALNKLCFNKKASSAKAKGVVLCTTRRETEEVNRRHATKLKTKTEVFNAQIEGIFLKNDYPTEAILQLNEGARVMTLVNKRHTDGSYEYINGDLGTISSIISNADGTCSV